MTSLDFGPTSQRGKRWSLNDKNGSQRKVLCLMWEKHTKLVIGLSCVEGDSVLGKCRRLHYGFVRSCTTNKSEDVHGFCTISVASHRSSSSRV